MSPCRRGIPTNWSSSYFFISCGELEIKYIHKMIRFTQEFVLPILLKGLLINIIHSYGQSLFWVYKNINAPKEGKHGKMVSSKIIFGHQSQLHMVLYSYIFTLLWLCQLTLFCKKVHCMVMVSWLDQTSSYHNLSHHILVSTKKKKNCILIDSAKQWIKWKQQYLWIDIEVDCKRAFWEIDIVLN